MMVPMYFTRGEWSLQMVLCLYMEQSKWWIFQRQLLAKWKTEGRQCVPMCKYNLQEFWRREVLFTTHKVQGGQYHYCYTLQLKKQKLWVCDAEIILVTDGWANLKAVKVKGDFVVYGSFFEHFTFPPLLSLKCFSRIIFSYLLWSFFFSQPQVLLKWMEMGMVPQPPPL